MILDKNGKPVKLSPPKQGELASIKLGRAAADNIYSTTDLATTSTQSSAKGLKVYDDMMALDAHVFSCTQTRRLGITGLEYEITPSPDGGTVEQVDFITAQIEKLGHQRLIMELMDGVFKGISIHEIMWGIEGATIIFSGMKQRDPGRFRFDLDKALYLKATSGKSVDDTLMDPMKFIVFAYDSRYDNPWGNAVLQRVFWCYWFKKYAMKYWSIFCEKFGNPTVMATYPPGANDDEIKELLDIAQAIQLDSVVAHRDDMIFSLMESARAGSVQNFNQWLAFLNSEISKAILGQTLTTEAGNVGSYALGKVHDTVRHDILEADAEAIMVVFNEQIIPRLCDYNLIYPYPIYQLLHQTQEADETTARTLSILVNELGLPVGAALVYEKFGIESPAPEDQLLPGRPAAPNPFGLMPGDEPEPAPTPNASSALPVVNAAKDVSKVTGLWRRNAQSRRILEAWEAASIARGSKAMGIKRAVIKNLLDKAENYGEALAGLSGLNRETPGMAAALADAIILGNLGGRWGVGLECKLQGHEIFAECAANQVPPPAPEAAIQWMRNKKVVNPVEFKKLQDASYAKSFTMAKEIDETILEHIKDNLTVALQTGQPYREWAKGIDKIYKSAGIEPQDPSYLKTVFRTNMASVYNAGRYEQQRDPDIAGLFPYTTYWTVDDGLVRDEHAILHGFTAQSDDPVWDTIYPPNGFNCRCDAVAMAESYMAQIGVRPTEIMPDFTPDPGFANNPALSGPGSV